METITATIPTTIPYEDAHYKWNYDDCGVICRFDKETEAWEPMEDHCVDCGHRPDDCNCEEEGGCVYCHDEDVYCHCSGCQDGDGGAMCRSCFDEKGWKGDDGVVLCHGCDQERLEYLAIDTPDFTAVLESLTQRPQTRATTKAIAELRRQLGLA